VFDDDEKVDLPTDPEPTMMLEYMSSVEKQVDDSNEKNTED